MKSQGPIKSSRRRRHENEGDPSIWIFLAIVTVVTATFLYFSISTYFEQGWNGRIKLRSGFITVQSGFIIGGLLLGFQVLMMWILLRKRARGQSPENSKSAFD